MCLSVIAINRQSLKASFGPWVVIYTVLLMLTIYLLPLPYFFNVLCLKKENLEPAALLGLKQDLQNEHLILSDMTEGLGCQNGLLQQVHCHGGHR